MSLLEDFLWRFRCPEAIDAISDHFVTNYVPMEHSDEFDFTTAYVDWVDPWFAYRRMIGSIYGIVICYKPPDDSPTKRGWNRRIWEKHKELTPDALVEAIFDNVLERIKGIVAQTKKVTEQGTASDR